MSLEAIEEIESPDYSQMSFNQLMSDGRVSNDFKQKVQLRLQKVGLQIGLIKLSDFSRRDIIEELKYNAKKEEELRAWLEAMKFRFLNDQLESLIEDERHLVDEEIDQINATIHKLEKTKGGAGQIEDLKRAREGLKGVKIELDGLDKERRASQNIRDLQEVADHAETTKSTSENVRSTMRRKRRETKRPETIQTRPTHDPARSSSHSTAEDDESGETGKSSSGESGKSEDEKQSARHRIDPYAERHVKPPPGNKPPPGSAKQPAAPEPGPL